MSEGQASAREIDLGAGLGPVILKVNGGRVEIDANGHVATADAPGDATPSTLASFGKRMQDKTVFAGFSPQSTEIYAAPEDAPLRLKYKEAAQYIKKLNDQNYLGHNDWRIGEWDDMVVLFNNRAAIGGFEEGRYWTDTDSRIDWTMHTLNFKNGDDGFAKKSEAMLLRPVRG